MKQYLSKIQEWLLTSDVVIINAGAGMGVDSGIADFRGTEGEWGKMEANTDRNIFEVSNPLFFQENPKLAWRLFAERKKKFEETSPHKGFYILQEIIDEYKLNYFILTSNIDNQFQKAGFPEDKIRELHGNANYLQCIDPRRSKKIWKNLVSADVFLEMIKNEEYPICEENGMPTRPNIYMFRDCTYLNTRSSIQKKNFDFFLKKHSDKKMLVIEIGSGPHVQSIRSKTRMLKTKYNANIIRINPYDYDVKPPHISVPKGALEALTEIQCYLKESKSLFL